MTEDTLRLWTVALGVLAAAALVALAALVGLVAVTGVAWCLRP